MDELAQWRDSLPAEWTAGCGVEVLEAARRAYDSPGRHYHTWRHILECADKLRGLRPEDPRAAFMAILFHDAVYVVGAKDNEERSAEMALAILERHSGMAATERAEVGRMIVATKHHRVPDAEPSRDLRIVVDLDMSILAADSARYDEYAEQVRDEWVPAAASRRAFRVGRLRFLGAVLAQERIFHSPDALSRWEGDARANVQREVVRLREEGDWLDGLLSRFARGS